MVDQLYVFSDGFFFLLGNLKFKRGLWNKFMDRVRVFLLVILVMFLLFMPISVLPERLTKKHDQWQNTDAIFFSSNFRLKKSSFYP